MSLEMGPLDFHLPTRVVFGWGAVSRARLARVFGPDLGDDDIARLYRESL